MISIEESPAPTKYLVIGDHMDDEICKIEDLGHWITELEIPSELPFGFIYQITSPSGRYYIGKKQCLRRVKRPPLKGKTRNRICWLESDWKTYYSSSTTIMEDIEANGEDGYTFEILQWADSKWALAYFEAKLQFENDVLFDDNSLNSIINMRINKAPKALQEKYDRGEI